jgi:hypothetical protein
LHDSDLAELHNIYGIALGLLKPYIVDDFVESNYAICSIDYKD